MRSDTENFRRIRNECLQCLGIALAILIAPGLSTAAAEGSARPLAAALADRNAGIGGGPAPSVEEAAALLAGQPAGQAPRATVALDQQGGSARADLQFGLDGVDGPVAGTAFAAGNVASVALSSGTPATIGIRQEATGETTASAQLTATRLGGEATVSAIAIGNSVALTSDGRLTGGDVLITQDNRGDIRASTTVRAGIVGGRITQSAVAIGNNTTITGAMR